MGVIGDEATRFGPSTGSSSGMTTGSGLSTPGIDGLSDKMLSRTDLHNSLFSLWHGWLVSSIFIKLCSAVRFTGAMPAQACTIETAKNTSTTLAATAAENLFNKFDPRITESG